jgi:hypothetical protein
MLSFLLAHTRLKSGVGEMAVLFAIVYGKRGTVRGRYVIDCKHKICHSSLEVGHEQDSAHVTAKVRLSALDRTSARSSSPPCYMLPLGLSPSDKQTDIYGMTDVIALVW